MTKPEYLTKSVAAKKLGISTRRLVELAAAGQIHRHYSNGPNSRRIALFEKSEVEHLAEVRFNSTPGTATTTALTPLRSIETIVQAIASYRGVDGGKPKIDALWLTPAEAAGYSGLPESFLVAMIEAKSLPALDVGVRKGGRWRIARKDVDAIQAPRQRRA